MKTLISNKRTIIISWLISYSLILMIPLFISAVIYGQTFLMFEKEVNSSNSLLLKKMQQRMDNILTDGQRLSEEISLNSKVRALLINDSNLDDIPSYELFQSITNLATYKIPVSSIDDFFIYYNHSDLILSNYSAKNSRYHFETYMNNSNVSFNQWYTTISGQYKGTFITTLDFSTKDKRKNTIEMIRTVPLLTRSGRYANIVISIDESKFLSDSADVEALNQGFIAIIDDKDKIISTSDNGFNLNGLNYDKLEGISGITHTKIDGKNVVVSYIKSDITNWKYMAIVPKEVFWEKTQYIKSLIILSIVLCLGIGGLLVYISLRKNYNPVHELVKLLEKSQGINFTQKDNEYSFIQQMVNQIQSDKHKVDDILKQQNKEIKANLLQRLIKGKVGGNLPLQDVLSANNIHFVTEDFAIIIFYIVDYSEAFSGEVPISADSNDLEKFRMVQFVMTNVIEEMLLQRACTGFMTDIDDILVCLVNIGASESVQVKEELNSLVDEASDFMYRHFKIQFKVAISNVHKTVTGIPEAYSEALQVLEYKRVLGVEEFIHYQDINEAPKGDYYYPLEIERQLINFIKAGDYESSQLILDDIFKRNFESSILSVKVARCLMFDLVSTMIKTINESSYSGYDDLMESINPVDTLINCENINEMKFELNRTLDGFCKLINAKNKNKNKEQDIQLLKSVVEYVNSNFSDAGLSVTTIAEYFNVHLVFLSRVFKEKYGEGLSEYINRVRIDKSKVLLNKLDNLEEVSRAVGYNNIRTFMRVFKKLEGITPGKFKGVE